MIRSLDDMTDDEAQQLIIEAARRIEQVAACKGWHGCTELAAELIALSDQS